MTGRPAGAPVNVPADPPSPLTAEGIAFAEALLTSPFGEDRFNVTVPRSLLRSLLDAARAPDAGLRAALETYGDHPSSCDVWLDGSGRPSADDPSCDPRQPHRGRGLFQHEPSAPCVVCDRSSPAPAGFTLEEDVAVQPDNGPRDGLNKG